MACPQPPNEWNDLTSKTTIRDLLNRKQYKELIFVKSNATIKETLKLLEKANILSVPVIRESDSSFIGFVDVLDILSYLLICWKECASSSRYNHAVHDYSHHRHHHYHSSYFPSGPFFNAPIVAALKFNNSPVVALKETAFVDDLLRTFANAKNHQNKHHLHRIAILCPEGNKVIGIITQSDVVAFAAANAAMMRPQIAKKAIANLGIIHPVISSRIDTPFLAALELLERNKISGLALTDHEFHLAGSFSASDLRGAKPTTFSFFNGSVTHFLAKGTTSNVHQVGPTLSATQTTSFQDVIHKVTEDRAHRIFIVDEYNRPIGIVSLTDIITRLL